jgi:uncharacterized protein
MIVSFSVSNFRSFSSEETISFVASKRLAGRHEDHTVPIPDSDERVLRAAVIYGANGAGKSNLFKALAYMETMALQPRPRNGGTGREIFRLGGGQDKPTVLDLQFIARDKLYRFGFKANDERITEEWLVQIVGGEERTIYERNTDETGKVTIDAPGLKDKLRALATLGGPQNQTFLATIRATIDPTDLNEDVDSILGWFQQSVGLIAPDTLFAWNMLDAHPELQDFAGSFLQSSSTGVEHLQISKKKITEDEVRRLVPDSVASQALAQNTRPGGGQIQIWRQDGGEELLIERDPKNHYYLTSVEAAHAREDGSFVSLKLNDESDGTRRLLTLIPALHDLQKRNVTYFVDEIDRSLHPILVRNFLDFFLKSSAGGPRQLIVTTHESNLLDLNLLRRDEIWFAEKDRAGATHLYSLTDFEPRKDSEIREHYLQGRFGAIPFLGDLDRLREPEPQPK